MYRLSAHLSPQGSLWPEHRESRPPDSGRTKAPECSDERNLGERLNLLFLCGKSVDPLLLVNYSRGEGALLLPRALSDQRWKVENTFASVIKYDLPSFSENHHWSDLHCNNWTIGKCTIHLSWRSNKNYFLKSFLSKCTFYIYINITFQNCKTIAPYLFCCPTSPFVSNIWCLTILCSIFKDWV